MGTVELNIRLDVRGQDNSASSITQREIQALDILGDCYHHRADYLDHGALVPRLVARLDTVDSATLHQECIAVFHPEQKRGELIGPFAAAWGEFEISSFQRVDLVTEYGESTGFGWDQGDSDRYHATKRLPA
jgi:hypothetical protein